MSNAVAKVSFLQGQAWAKAPDGSLRALTVGSTLNDDEILVTAQGARVELDVGNAEPLVVNGGQEVGMSRDFASDTATSPDEALLSDASVQEALTVLEQGGDLLEELEETAAGDSSGGGGEGHGFVQLTRIIESTDPLSFEYSSNTIADEAPLVFDGGPGSTNQAPTATDQTLTSNEDEVVSSQIIATDLEGNALTYTVARPPVNGQLVLDPATGQFTFTPNLNFNGPDSFVVTVTDSTGRSTTTNVTLNITPVNDAPTAANVNIATNEDTPVNGQISAQDIDGDSLTYVVSGNPANGTVTLNPATGAFTYTPNVNYNGGDSFVVTTSDGNGGTVTSTVTVGVAPVNDVPVSADLSLTTDEDQPVNGQIVASDIDGDALTFTVSGNPANGTVTLNAATGSFVYTPNGNYNGSDSFVVTISDGNGGTTTSTISIGVNPVNDVPVSSNQNLTTDENTALPGQIVASDVDGDILAYTITGNPSNGTITLNPATGAFVYTPNANYNGSDSFVVTISDGKGGTTTSTISIGVNPVNDAPTASNQNLTTDEDVALPGQIVANDIDGDALTYAVTTTAANGIVTINATTGVFVYTPNTNYNGADSFVVTVSDGKGGTTTSTISIGVNPVNDAPVANTDTAIVDEDSSIVIPVRSNDTDAEGDSLTVTGVSQGANGSVVIDAITGNPIYTPNAGFSGADSFIYTISDGNGGTATATVNVTVNSINHAPVAVADTFTVAEGGTLTGAGANVLTNDTDSDGNSLTAILVTGPANGTLTLNANGTFTYIHNGSETTTDSFTYKVNDGTVDGNTVTVTINVTPVNDAPVAVADTFTVAEGGTLTGAGANVLSNDTDAEGNTLTAILVTGPSNGTLTLNANGTFTYIHNGSETTTDSFTYKVNDGTVDGNTVTVTINVTPVNDAPVAVADTFTVAEGGTLTGAGANVLTNDTDAEGNPLTAILVFGPTNGTLTLNANGTFTYIHNGSETTVDSFTYKVNDGTVDGNTVTVTINVTPVNDAPIANDDTATVNEGDSVIVAVRNNDTDTEGDSLTVNSITQGANGSVVIDMVSGNPVYTPNAGYSGSDSFTYTISDGNGGTATATVNVTVNSINHAPVAVADTFTVAEGGTLTGAGANVLTNDTDSDGNSLTAILVTGPANGTLTLNANGTFTYIHNGSETTVDSFTYKVNDGTVDGNTVTVTINVTPVNDAPVAVADTFTVAEGGTLTGAGANVLTNDTDAEGNPLTAILVTGPANGTLTLNADGTFTYIHNGSETTTDSFTYKVNDGTVDGNTVTVTINVTPVNDAPQTNALTVSGDEDKLITIALSGSDVDGTVAGYVIKSLPANGVLFSDALMTTQVSAGDLVSGPVYFMPNANWNGGASFDYAARDNLGLEDSTPATVSITVNPVPDAAIIGGTTSGGVKEDTPAQASASGTLTIVDPDAGEQAFQAQTNVARTYGTFSISAGGNWTYNIDNSKPVVQALKEGETKTENITVTSIDGTTATVVITITGTNDGPVAVADTASVNQDAVLTLTPAQLLANDFDIDGDTLSVESVQNADNGTVKIEGGNVVFTPTAGYHGQASFTYTVSDGKGGTATATVTVDVIKANTPPDANDDSPVASSGNTGFVSEYYGYREGPDGANLTNLQQIHDFIRGHTADATFTAKTFNYGENFTSGDDLGYGTNLQTFLGSDAASLSADPGDTSDAIIRMRGFVELDAGAYNFKVIGDDGYQILIDGVVVAERNLNQAQTETTHDSFTLAMSGLHHVEIIYWDQGNYARLEIELSNDGGATYNPLSSIPNYSSTAFNVMEDVPFTFSAGSLLDNDTDADGDTLTIIDVQSATHGTAYLFNGNIIFQSALNYSGPASFTYTISDGKGGTDTATVNFVVQPVNDAPTAVNDTGVTAMNTAVNIPIATLLANDTDIDGDPISFVGIQDAANGTAVLSGSEVRFTPTTGFEGIGSFTYTIRDALGATGTATVNVAVGAATPVSVVVAKSLLAVAHGTGGTSVKFPITTQLVDTDGSESLSIKVSNVPNGLSFNSGTNLGGGVWQFSEADLPNLMLNIPGSYTTLATNLTVQVTSTEMYGGFTASTSTVVTLKAAYTTVDVATTEGGSFTGTAANEFIQGGSGNNTIHAGGGNNIVYGGDGDDNIVALAGSDIIFGGAGNDYIHGGAGTDRISGGAGNDILIGGDAGENFVDVFVWELGDQGAAGAPAVDTIKYFSTAAAASAPSANTAINGGDVLDLRDLLQGESVGPNNSAGNLADYLHFEVAGGNTIIHISHNGGFSGSGNSHEVGGSFTGAAETQTIVLEGVNLQSVYVGATTDQQIITQLLNNNKLITD